MFPEKAAFSLVYPDHLLFFPAKTSILYSELYPKANSRSNKPRRNSPIMSSMPFQLRLRSRINRDEARSDIPVVQPTTTQLPTMDAPHTAWSNFAAVVGESISAFMFPFFALEGYTNSQYTEARGRSAASNLLHVSPFLGFSLVVNTWIYPATGDLFGPAVHYHFVQGHYLLLVSDKHVSLALCLCGDMNALRSLLVFAAQAKAGMTPAGGDGLFVSG